jgi:nucleoid DNA-binding protein
MTGNAFAETVAAQQGATKAEVKKIIDAALSAIADATARAAIGAPAFCCCEVDPIV